MNTGYKPVKSKNGLITTLGACVDGKPPYVLEGSVFVGGAVVQWLRDGLQLISSADESEKCALSVEDSGGVYVVPAFTGLGAPYWDSSARGILTGITRGTSRGHIVRAALESIAYQVSDIVQSMQKDAGIKINRLASTAGRAGTTFCCSFRRTYRTPRCSAPRLWKRPRSARRISRVLPSAYTICPQSTARAKAIPFSRRK